MTDELNQSHGEAEIRSENEHDVTLDTFYFLLSIFTEIPQIPNNHGDLIFHFNPKIGDKRH